MLSNNSACNVRFLLAQTESLRSIGLTIDTITAKKHFYATKKYAVTLALLSATAATFSFTATPAAAVNLQFVQSFGTTGSGSGQFSRPLGVELDSSGNVYVTDNGNNRIVRFNFSDPAGTFTSFGTNGSGSGQFFQPGGVAIDSSGNVYVADHGNNRIVRFNFSDPAGTFTSFGTFGSGSGQFRQPSGVAIDSSGNVYVADLASNYDPATGYYGRIDRFNPSNFAGTFTSFGTGGSGSGQFFGPEDVAVDISSGNVYVADARNNRIDRFNFSDPAGTFTSFGTSGSGSGQFNYPGGVALDSSGNVYVADIFNHRVVNFDPSNFAGTFTSFGTIGSGSGQFIQPTGITVDSSGNVYVADLVNSRIVQLSAVNAATAVPEPSEIVGTLLAAGSVVAMRRRLRHQQQNEL